MIHSTFTIERRYAAPPDKVYSAFADAAKKRRWFVEGDHHDVEYHDLDFRVGGKETARFRFKEGTPVAGLACLTDTWYLELSPNQRVVMAQTMTLNGGCISAALVTIELEAVDGEKLLTCTHQGAFFEGADGPQMREMGWQVLLGKLSAEF